MIQENENYWDRDMTPKEWFIGIMVCVLLIVLIIWHDLATADPDRNLKSMIGAEIIYQGDTSKVVNYSTVYECFVLENGKRPSIDYVFRTHVQKMDEPY